MATEAADKKPTVQHFPKTSEPQIDPLTREYYLENQVSTLINIRIDPPKLRFWYSIDGFNLDGELDQSWRSFLVGEDPEALLDKAIRDRANILKTSKRHNGSRPNFIPEYLTVRFDRIEFIPTKYVLERLGLIENKPVEQAEMRELVSV